jgi:hypothetical protein
LCHKVDNVLPPEPPLASSSGTKSGIAHGTRDGGKEVVEPAAGVTTKAAAAATSAAALNNSTTMEFHGGTLPASSGQWKGSFDTIRGRKGHQKRIPVPEHFSLQWNRTAAPDDDDDDRSVRTTTTGPFWGATKDDDGSTTTTATTTLMADADKQQLQQQEQLPPHPPTIHVIGKGENQYGYFELVGSFDAVTGILQCQKNYVAREEMEVPLRSLRRWMVLLLLQLLVYCHHGCTATTAVPHCGASAAAGGREWVACIS